MNNNSWMAESKPERLDKGCEKITNVAKKCSASEGCNDECCRPAVRRLISAQSGTPNGNINFKLSLDTCSENPLRNSSNEVESAFRNNCGSYFPGCRTDGKQENIANLNNSRENIVIRVSSSIMESDSDEVTLNELGNSSQSNAHDFSPRNDGDELSLPIRPGSDGETMDCAGLSRPFRRESSISMEEVDLTERPQRVREEGDNGSQPSHSQTTPPNPTTVVAPRINNLTLTLPMHPQESSSTTRISPYIIPSAGYQRRQIDPFRLILAPRQRTSLSPYSSTSSISLNDFHPTLTSSIFSFMMTLIFVLVLWLVVFMVFGSRGHAIAGVFVGLFFIGILLNTCFLKFYFRLRLFLGMGPDLVAVERDGNVRQRAQNNLQNEVQVPNLKAAEEPPSYSVVEESPPPYDLLQYYTENPVTTTKEATTSSVTSSTTTSCDKERHYTCPYCENEGTHFGLCDKCQTKLA